METGLSPDLIRSFEHDPIITVAVTLVLVVGLMLSGGFAFMRWLIPTLSSLVVRPIKEEMQAATIGFSKLVESVDRLDTTAQNLSTKVDALFDTDQAIRARLEERAVQAQIRPLVSTNTPAA